MKKKAKRIFSGIVGVVLVIVLLFLGYFLVAKSMIKKMSPVETGEIVKNVFSVKDSFVNFYFIKHGENYIAVDAGNNKNAIKQELKRLNIEAGKVDAIFLTHTDGDHLGGISLFKNGNIYLSRPEEQLLNGNKSRFFIFGNKIESNKYVLTEDQQTINIGDTKIQCFLTPGHTPGSMCYLVNDSLLFTGDALKLNNGKVEKFYRLFNMDSETACQSIGEIAHIPGVHYLFTAHNGYTNDFDSAFNYWNLNN